MSIDEAIAKYKEITNTDANCPAHCNISCDKCLQESKQIAEWLEELKSYRASVFSGYMTQKMLKEEYNKAIDDFAEKLKEKSTFWKSIENDYYGYVSEDEIDEIAEQMKAGDRENGKYGRH